MEEKDTLERFRRLHITTRSYEEFETNANSLLDQLTSYGRQLKSNERPGTGEHQFLSEQDLCSFISYGCKILNDKCMLTKSKFANCLSLILVNEKRLLPKEVVPLLISFLMTCLPLAIKSLKVSFLQALAASFYGNGGNIDLELLDDLLGATSVFWAVFDPAIGDYTVQIKAVDCIGSLCTRNSSGMSVDKSFVRIFYQKVMDFLRLIPQLESTDNLDFCKLVAKSLKVLQSIISLVTFQDHIIEPEFAIALLRVYLAYGLPGFQSTVDNLIKNLPSARTVPVFEADVVSKKIKSPVAKQVVKKKRKAKKSSNKKNFKSQDEEPNSQEELQGASKNQMENDDILRVNTSDCLISSQSSSESEFSDPESNYRSRLRTACSRIRQNACKCIQDIFKISDRRAKLSSWLFLVPDSASPIEPSLMSCFKNDPSSKVRLSALATLMEFINDSKQYLEAAVVRSQLHQPTARSFVPFSVKLNLSLIALHEAFIDYFGDKRPDFAIEKALQCLSILVLNTPYEKIGTEKLYKIFQIIPKYLCESDTNVIISSLTCLAATLSVRPEDSQIQAMLLANPKSLQRHLSIHQNDRSNIFKSWLVRYCFIEIDRDDAESVSEAATQNRVQNQSLQLLKIVVQFFPCFITSAERKDLITSISDKYIKMSDCSLSFHSIKLLEEFGKSFSKMNSEFEKCCKEEIEFWRGVLNGPLIKLFQYQAPVFKILSAACDVLATVSAACFECLNIRDQIMIKTLLLGAADDVDIPVKSAAIRALGILVTYPFVKEDDSFLIDVGGMIFKQLTSYSLNVRTKAAWSLGNFTDSVLKNKIAERNEDRAEFSVSFIRELLTTCKNAALDHDKVKANGVRAIGNVLKWIPLCSSENHDLKLIIEDVIHSLIQNISSGPMKARWNACYACANMFQGGSLSCGGAVWTDPLLTALGNAMKDCKNFKVRISAASALSILKFRSNFGSTLLFARTWNNAVGALLSSENLSDFTEFKFKNNLQNKICGLLLQLICIAIPDDLAIIQPSITENSDLISKQIGRFIDEMTKEENENQEDKSATQILDKDLDISCLVENLSMFAGLKGILTRMSSP